MNRPAPNHFVIRTAFLVGGSIVLIAFYSGISAYQACLLPKAAEGIITEIAKANGCFEFWANRYQSISGQLITTIVAAVALWPVFKQFRLLNKQRDLEIAKHYSEIRSFVRD